MSTKFQGFDDEGHVHGHFYSLISNYTHKTNVNKYFVGILKLGLPRKT